MGPYTGPLDGAPATGGGLLRGCMLFFSGKRGRILVLLVLAWVLFMCMTSGGPDSPVYYKNIKDYKLPTFQMPKWSLGDSKPIAKPSLSPLSEHSNKTSGLAEELKEDGEDTKETAAAKDRNPRFHLIVTTSASSEDYCKSILSAMLGNYPPPTIIHARNSIVDADHARASLDLEKISGVQKYLQDTKHVAEDDLVLVIDGFGTWFQLPSDVLIGQYQRILEVANIQLEKKYGTVDVKKVTKTGKKTTEAVPRFTQDIVFGAEKLCRPNSEDSAACSEVPDSTLDKNTYGDVTDEDKEGYKNRPKYLEAATIIGSASSMRTLYDATYAKALKTDRSQQYIFAEMFGEQEKARAATRKKKHQSRGISGWLGLKGNAKRDMSSSPSTHDVDENDSVPDEDKDTQETVEFGIGLDYYGILWQTTSRLADDEVDFLTHNRMKKLHSLSASRPLEPNLKLPKALTDAKLPFAEPEDARKHSRRARVEKLPSPDTDWHEVFLAQNTYTGSIPAALVFSELEAAADHTSSFKTDTDASHAGTAGHAHNTNATDAANTDWWPRMWFFPHSRALLKRYMGQSQGPVVVGGGAKTKEGQEYEVRGGRGGVWINGGKEWVGWSEVCYGVEEVVFQDEKGTWGANSEKRGGEKTD